MRFTGRIPPARVLEAADVVQDRRQSQIVRAELCFEHVECFAIEPRRLGMPPGVLVIDAGAPCLHHAVFFKVIDMRGAERVVGCTNHCQLDMPIRLASLAWNAY